MHYILFILFFYLFFYFFISFFIFRVIIYNTNTYLLFAVWFQELLLVVSFAGTIHSSSSIPVHRCSCGRFLGI